jgi:hypothetical protein
MDKKGRIALISALVLAVALLVVFVMAAKPECMDKKDNDGDGNIDYPDDTGCSYKQDNDETDCGDGVCEGGETSGTCPEDCGSPDSCSDTDGGNVITVFGTASGYFNGNPYSDDDYCVDASNIMEYYCSGDYEQSSQQSCGTDFYGSPYCSSGDTIYKDLTDYFCNGGECDSDVTPEFQEDCDDNDGYGSPYCSGSDIYKDYDDYFCIGGACDYNSTPEFQQDCDDLDSYGPNYCFNNSVYRDFNNSYCSGGSCHFTEYPEWVETCTAPEECVDGECVIPDSCSDTDGGFIPPTWGNVTGYLNEIPFSYGDYCNDTAILTEYFCSGDYPWSGGYDCVANNYTGCAGGTCY